MAAPVSPRGPGARSGVRVVWAEEPAVVLQVTGCKRGSLDDEADDADDPGCDDLDDDDDTDDVEDDDDHEGEWHVIVDDPQTVDLMELRDGATTTLDTAEMEEGCYTQIRLHLTSDNTIVVDGETEPLMVPSGEQTGIKIPFGYDVDPDRTYELLLDFDAAESVHQTGTGQWMLRPVILVESFAEVPDDTSDTATAQRMIR